MDWPSPSRNPPQHDHICGIQDRVPKSLLPLAEMWPTLRLLLLQRAQNQREGLCQAPFSRPGWAARCTHLPILKTSLETLQGMAGKTTRQALCPEATGPSLSTESVQKCLMVELYTGSDISRKATFHVSKIDLIERLTYS